MENHLKSLGDAFRGVRLDKMMMKKYELNESSTGVILAVGVLVLISLVLLVLPTRRELGEKLKIDAIYIYPVKGLRGCALEAGTIGRYGFRGDRTFCLQKVHRDHDTKEVTRYETMFIGYNLEMALFATCLDNKSKGLEPPDVDIIVTWTGDGYSSHELSWNAMENQVRFPMKPEMADLQTIHVNLHGSPTPAYDMGDDLSTWFSQYLSVEVRLAYIGEYTRAVLGSMAPHSSTALKKAPFPSRLRSLIPFLKQAPERIVFNDLGQYLIVTRESNAEVTLRLSSGLEMDITKFRPNIVLSGSPCPFVEDFWAELFFPSAGNVSMALTANCYRCQSITVDYETGKPAADDRGLAWKKLNKDRRVDKGAKYSPVFGRYGFCRSADVGKRIEVGREVVVTRKNRERTTFDCSFPISAAAAVITRAPPPHVEPRFVGAGVTLIALVFISRDTEITDLMMSTKKQIFKIGVLGPAGFGGSYVSVELISRGHHVVGISRHPEAFGTHRNYEARPLDLEKSNAGQLAIAFQGLDILVSAYGPHTAGHEALQYMPYLEMVRKIVIAVKHAKIGYFVMIGGTGSLHVPGDPVGDCVIDNPSFFLAYRRGIADSHAHVSYMEERLGPMGASLRRYRDARIKARNHEADAEAENIVAEYEHKIQSNDEASSFIKAGRTSYMFFEGNTSFRWTYVSPSALYRPGKRTGKYEIIIDDLPLSNIPPASSNKLDGRLLGITAADLAVAIADEIELQTHLGMHWTAIGDLTDDTPTPSYVVIGGLNS